VCVYVYVCVYAPKILSSLTCLSRENPTTSHEVT